MNQGHNAVVDGIHIHPVKSVGGYDRAQAAVEPWGLAGDRRWMLVDTQGVAVTQRERPALALSSAATLPGGSVRLSAPGHDDLVVEPPRTAEAETVSLFGGKFEAVAADGEAHQWFSSYLGTAVRLMHLDDPAHRRAIDARYAPQGETVSFADGFPLQIATRSSLDALNALIAQGDHAAEGPLPMNRFRPNVVLGHTEPWAEDSWSRIAIGEVVFRLAKPCGRCVITTTDQATAERGKEPLRSLARHRRIGGALAFGVLVLPENTGTIHVGDPMKVLA
ncbi:MOSC domain-containing protein [Streptomyces sp. NBC_00083]|uniref:MOSC domain-containing protein n=1 Tax=Streptomyces sp. NBC_00083 TaxID=2975647 RepID=UPI00225AC6C1|nr:MOSC N-terminal beta barrel domain-containing protein [Streptomyces sp. NBC_00083]MCX5383912.1 MOSC domain-containing protein [Streptomyces sp. NBC_00083]